MIDLRIQIIAHNVSTPSHFFFYDFIEMLTAKCGEGTQGPKRNGTEGSSIKASPVLKDD